MSNITKTAYRIMNMCCPVEEALIRKKLASMPGITDLTFNLMERMLIISHTLPAAKSIEAELALIGLEFEPAGSNGEAVMVPAAPQISWQRLAAAGVFAAASEAFELLSEWKITVFGIDLNALKAGGLTLNEYLPFVLAVSAILLGGLTMYGKGWMAIKNLNLNINALMSAAVTGALIIGHYSEAAMVMLLFTLAEIIEDKAVDRARNAVKKLFNLAPEKATVRLSDGSWAEMDIRQVAAGSLVRVKPGERVAMDGIVVRGQSAVNQSPITGESLPVEKSAGDVVYAGTINESGSFEFQVSAPADGSTLARIIRTVSEAQTSRAPIQRLIDQFAKYYTPAMFLSALLTMIIPPLLTGGAWTNWIYTALVLLVIGCPCALVISTPVTIVSGMAAAARHGILIKGGIFLEQGRRLKSLALDKTGTLTHGQPRLTDFLAIGAYDGADAVALAASLAARSDHPVSTAIAQYGKGVALFDVADFAAIPGQGLSGVIGGEKWHLGNHRLVEELNLCSAALEENIFALEKQGKSVVALVGKQGVRALFAVADTLKPGSIEAVHELKRLGLITTMLTGDNEHTARAVAAQAGVDSFMGNLLPEDKLAVIERLAEKGQVGMVGDGINDAPALARADIGFAMAAAGSDTAIETADVALMDDDLGKIPRFIRLSRSTFAILAQNITLALVVKAIFFILTFMGHATMWMAVFADTGISLLVVGNALRVLRK
ncbi:MAG: heavy metal translocating P-type ATPase [Candidatus Adiutrix sp.]|jgi:Cd2+/Zn2+-exporting ATPase|nr:heavy metal translocating P-type ATPase [Candidatus Adiutrix sp.]